MPYCPKCGVELEKNKLNCPLCNFIIPKIDTNDEDNDYMTEYPLKFPIYENRQIIDFTEIKRRTFYAITFLFLLNILFFLTKQILNNKLNLGFIYLIFYIISIWFYLLIFSEIISNKKILIFLFIVNSFFITFLIDISIKGLGWFIPVFLPATIFGSIILIITASIIRLKKKKDFSIIFNIALALSIFIIGAEIIINNYLYHKIILSWSIIISAEIITLSLLLLFFYYKIPSIIKKKIKMKIHI